MDVFHDDVGGVKGQILACEIPKRLDPKRGKVRADFFGGFLGEREDGEVYGDTVTKAIQCLHIAYGHTAYHSADLRGVNVEHGKNIYASLFEHGSAHQGTSKVARADHDGLQLGGDAQQLADVGIQIFHVVAVALLPEATEAVEILSDLGRGDIHHARKLSRADACPILTDQLAQIAKIAWQAAYDRVRNHGAVIKRIVAI